VSFTPADGGGGVRQGGGAYERIQLRSEGSKRLCNRKRAEKRVGGESWTEVVKKNKKKKKKKKKEAS